MKYNGYQIGQSFTCPPISLTLEEIMDFAQKYDPLPIHLDEDFVKTTQFKEIFASGFHTLVATWSQWVKMEYWNEDVVAGISIDELLWKKPVYPQDELTPVITIVDKIETSSPKQGILVVNMKANNQNNDLVIDMTCKAMIKKETYEE